MFKVWRACTFIVMLRQWRLPGHDLTARNR